MYYCSGLFAGAWHFSLAAMHATMAVAMVGSWTVFDGTAVGALVVVLTALGGPAIEFFLINQLGLYSYTAADFFGIDSWIPWVYGAGGPAVGNLARGYLTMLQGGNSDEGGSSSTKLG